jgi:SAM-dependent methyltransferase
MTADLKSVAAVGSDPLSSEPNRCLVCGGAYGASRLPGLSQCTACKFISADLSVSDDVLARLYGEDYFHGEEYLDYIAEEDSLRLNFRDRIDTLRRFVPNVADAELFEIGCAYGFFLEEVRNVVRTASGIDISGDAVRYAVTTKGVDARQGDYLKLDLGHQVDVIAMWDTIEHLKHPDLFIAKAARDIRSGGVIAITTGDIGSLNAAMRGRKWRMIHPPTHLHYFSVSTLGRLLEANGFDLVHVSHPGNSRTLRSIAYFILAIQMRNKALYEKISGFRFFDWHLTANLVDIMYVIARRR